MTATPGLSNLSQLRGQEDDLPPTRQMVQPFRRLKPVAYLHVPQYFNPLGWGPLGVRVVG
jgi:hypothetical protein